MEIFQLWIYYSHLLWITNYFYHMDCNIRTGTHICKYWIIFPGTSLLCLHSFFSFWLRKRKMKKYYDWLVKTKVFDFICVYILNVHFLEVFSNIDLNFHVKCFYESSTYASWHSVLTCPSKNESKILRILNKSHSLCTIVTLSFHYSILTAYFVHYNDPMW